VPEVRFAFLLQAMMNIKSGKKLTDPNPLDLRLRTSKWPLAAERY
jgi:hypothetical protein